jgi:hypothetical protein
MNHIFIIATPLITTMLYLITENLLIITIISTTIFTLVLLYIYNSLNRKESLNIIKSNNRIYFHLSDDELFSITIPKDEALADVLIDAISREIATIKEMVDSIYFINFKDDKLHKKLNEIIKPQH